MCHFCRIQFQLGGTYAGYLLQEVGSLENGKMYGYKRTELMLDLDVFLVRSDILQATCSNADSLPTFEWLGAGRLDVPVHRHCDKTVAAERFVDFPLALIGRDEEAPKKAMDYVEELRNKDWAKKGKKRKFCGRGEFTSYSMEYH
jgi:hypothetical protein